MSLLKRCFSGVTAAPAAAAAAAASTSALKHEDDEKDVKSISLLSLSDLADMMLGPSDKGAEAAVKQVGIRVGSIDAPSFSDLYDAGVMHGGVHMLTRRSEAAYLLFAGGNVEYTESSLVDIFHLPGFQDLIVPQLRLGDECMLYLVWNMADYEVLAKPLCKVPGLLVALLDGCRERPWSSQLQCSVNALRNLTMFPQSRDELLSQLDRTTLLQIITRVAKCSDETVNVKAVMAIANLVGRDEHNNKQPEPGGGGHQQLVMTTLEMLERIVSILKLALTEAGAADYLDEIDKLEGPYRLHEPLLSLRNLSVSSFNRAALLPMLRDVLPVTLQQAQKEEVCRGRAVRDTLAICSQFAFDAECLEWFQQHTDLEHQVKQILAKVHAGEDAEEYDAALRHEAEGLLWTLGGDKMQKKVEEEEAISASSAAAPSTKPQVMISYSWAQKDMALKIATFLRHHGLLVWQDVDDMKHNIMESMAQGVQDSFAVIILLSKNYKESANCQREANYAARRNKKIIPLVVLEDGYSGDGWLELFIAPLLYYDVTRDFDGVLTQVLNNEIGKKCGVVVDKASSSLKTAVAAAVLDLTASEVAAKVSLNFPELAYLQLALEREEMDLAAVRRLVSAWGTTGCVSADEVKATFGVKSLSHLLKLKEALEELV